MKKTCRGIKNSAAGFCYLFVIFSKGGHGTMWAGNS
jgi:hypothetical protein